MTAIELEQVFDQLSPHQQHYFRFPDSEMVTFDRYRIVFPKWDKAENRQNYVTDNNLTVPFDDIKVEEKEVASANRIYKKIVFYRNGLAVADFITNGIEIIKDNYILRINCNLFQRFSMRSFFAYLTFKEDMLGKRRN